MSRSFIDSAIGGLIVPQCYSSCVPAITSRRNPIVARFRAVAKGDRTDELLLDGVHLVGEAIAAGLRMREAVVTAGVPGDNEAGHGGASDIADIAERLRRLDVPVTTASAAVMHALSRVQSASPVVAIAERPVAAVTRVYNGTSVVLIALDVQDPGNVGAIVRVAEAGGASGVVCAGACADPFGWKALRGSMGSALRMPILVHRDSREAIDEARRRGCRIVATVPRGGRPLFDADLRGSIAVLIGGEGPGLAAAHVHEADERITIPMQPPVESLNTAVSAALIVYEARRQRA
jgi:RNA methyltransferase, TrmH family